jgi:GAF domain-containing protein
MADELSPADELAAVFARMSGLLLSEETVRSALELVTSLAVETIPGAAGAGVTLLDPEGRPTTAAASDPLVDRADAAQYELDEGPCLTAWRQRQLVRIDDTATEPRWPRWSGVARGLGLRAVLSVPLVAADSGLGAIKVYATTPGVFDARSEHLLTLFAGQAAVLLANLRTYRSAERVSEELRDALQMREVIGQAKGVLMGRNAIDDHAAFLLLVATARRENRPLRETARGIVANAAGRPRWL